MYNSNRSMTICHELVGSIQCYHGLVGNLYFHPVQEFKTLDWLEVYTSNQSKIKIVMDLLEVYTSGD